MSVSSLRNLLWVGGEGAAVEGAKGGGAESLQTWRITLNVVRDSCETPKVVSSGDDEIRVNKST